MAKRRFVPTWRDWVRNETVCFRSARYFETVGAIKKLSETIARDNVLGHLPKANHNLRLANRLFDMQENNQFDFAYEGETNFDWVVTVSYYAMYQSCLSALAAVRKSGEAHAATVCALIYHYFHKKRRLNEQYLISPDRINALASQDIQKLAVGKDQREKASYDSSFSTQRGIAQAALTDAREFVTKIREILEDGFGPEFMKGV